MENIFSVEFGLPEVDEFTLSKINLNFYFLLRGSYLLSAAPGLVSRRGLEDPEDSANKSKEFERSQGFFMIRERRNDKNLEPFYAILGERKTQTMDSSSTISKNWNCTVVKNLQKMPFTKS